MLVRYITRFISKMQQKVRYLEIAEGLNKALQKEFLKRKSDLRVCDNADFSKLPFAYARIEKGKKFVQIYIAATEKNYLPDFWKEGVCLANGKTKNFDELVTAIEFWFGEDISTKEFAEKFSFIIPNKKAEAFDTNSEIEYAWGFLLENNLELHDFVQLARKDEILSCLFPYTSLHTLRFSRCTGYPYDSNDLPEVTPKMQEFFGPVKSEKKTGDFSKNVYIVSRNGNKFLGEGTAEEALKLVKLNLPYTIQPSRKGTFNNK